jgi:hypothetical protein
MSKGKSKGAAKDTAASTEPVKNPIIYGNARIISGAKEACNIGVKSFILVLILAH